MLFSDSVFFVFFAVYFVCHVLTPPRHRNLLIIAGSTFFYGYWNPYYLWVPYVLMAVSFGGALYIDAAVNDSARKGRLISTIALLMLPLLCVKYTNFFWGSVIGLVRDVEVPLVDWSLPLGISFVTFTVTAYVVDVYRKTFPVERSLSKMAAYVLFFPHLIAGPILRPHNLIPQLGNPLKALDGRFVLGFSIFTIGLVKKLVFADQLAVYVERVYGSDAVLHGLDYVIAIYGYSLQIFCDFSGYTDMAIGLAIVLRIRLPNNFHRPYTAASLVEFWRRWHVTLSRWLRDYLYIPLGGNRFGFSRQLTAILITMILGGLWHGANWTFALWGLVHGVGIAMSHIMRRMAGFTWISGVPGWIKILITFHVVTLAWILFRSPDMVTAARVISGPLIADWSALGEAAARNAYPLVLMGLFYVTHGIDGHARIRFALQRLSVAVVWPILMALWALAITISAGSSAKFIYFDF